MQKYIGSKRFVDTLEKSVQSRNFDRNFESDQDHAELIVYTGTSSSR